MSILRNYVGKTITGKEFNEKNQRRLLKILNHNLNHRGFQYKIGFNEYTEGLNNDHPKTRLHFTDLKNIYFFFSYGTYIADIRIPDDAMVYIINIGIYRTNKLIILDVVEIDKSDIWDDYSFCLRSISNNGLNICYMPEDKINDFIVELAINQNPYAIQYLSKEKQTSKLCQLALRLNNNIFQFISTPTHELYLLAIKENPDNIKFVHKSSQYYRELCLIALKLNPFTFKYMVNNDNIDDENVYSEYINLCKLAINLNPMNIKFIDDPTQELCFLAVNKNPYSIKHIDDPSAELIETAILLNPDVLYYCIPRDPVLIENAIRRNPFIVQYFDSNFSNLEIYRLAKSINPLVIETLDINIKIKLL